MTRSGRCHGSSTASGVPEQLPLALLAAMRVLTDPAETGAVTLALPQDVQAQAFDWPEDLFRTRVWPLARPVPEPGSNIPRRGSVLSSSLACPSPSPGGGVLYSEAQDALRRLANRKRASRSRTPRPLRAPWRGDHPQACGRRGRDLGLRAGERAGRRGRRGDRTRSRYSDFTTASRTAFEYPAVRFINVNVTSFDAYKQAATAVEADARRALEALAAGLDGPPRRGWLHRGVPGHDGRRGCGHRPRLPPRAPAAPPAQTKVIGAVNEGIGPRDVVVQAAGSLPGDLQMLFGAPPAP